MGSATRPDDPAAGPPGQAAPPAPPAPAPAAPPAPITHRALAHAHAVWRAVTGHLVKIRYRLLLVNALVVAIPIVGIGFARTFEREMLHVLEADMIHQAQLLREAIYDDPRGARLDARSAMLARTARYTRTRIRILDTTGRVVSDSHGGGPPEGAERPAPSIFGSGDTYHAPEVPRAVDVSDRREVKSALAGSYGSATRLWENHGRVYLFAALPLRDTLAPGAKVDGVVYVTRSTAPVKFAMFRLRTWLIVVLAVALAVTAVLSVFLAGTIARPLARLTRAANRIARGDRRPRLTLRRRDEIGQLARAFDTMTARLDDRARHTAELAANISHEFKSPLTSIRGAAELLREGAADDVPARERFLGNIIEDTHRLDRLVTRLLELSRVEADTAPVVIFDYEALVRECAARVDAGMDVGVDVVYRAADTQLPGRRAHIASALGNLVDNAAQHAAPDTRVRVVVTDGPGGTVRTSVTNRGPAISPATMQQLWERFFTTRAKQGGTGLGLAIVRSIVTAHGGAVSVTSDDAGTTFSFDLPRA